MKCHPILILKPLMTTVGLAAFTIGCAGGLPAVISSTSENVAVEFNQKKGLKKASDLALEECKRFGKSAEFDKVDMTATPTSRIARFQCVSAKPERDEY
jgi:hypothetical protein